MTNRHIKDGDLDRERVDDAKRRLGMHSGSMMSLGHGYRNGARHKKIVTEWRPISTVFFDSPLRKAINFSLHQRCTHVSLSHRPEPTEGEEKR